jgi:tRNA A37 threonylcarbamoyladenosine dehydratase
LYGQEALHHLATAHACVIGIGGVGSWAAEALARCGVGHLMLIDLDHIAESNTNRQIHALEGTYGCAKVQAMATRIQAINPLCQITPVDDFITVDNIAQHLTAQTSFVIDAIDDIPAKAALIAYCRERTIPLITAAAAGGRRDPTRIQVADLARTEHDPLAARLRATLRKDYGFPRGSKQNFGVECVFSTEPVIRPNPSACHASPPAQAAHAPQGLNCAGYGSVVMVTASFGMVAAARAIEHLITPK